MGIRVSNIARAERVRVLLPTAPGGRPRRAEGTTAGFRDGEYLIHVNGQYVTVHESRVQHASGPSDCGVCGDHRTRIDMTAEGMALVCDGCGRVIAIDGIATY